MYTKNDIQVAYDKIIENKILGREDFQIAGEAALVMRGLHKTCATIVFLLDLDIDEDGWAKFSQALPDFINGHHVSLNAVSESGEPIEARFTERIGCLDGLDLTPDLLEGGYRVMSVRCLMRRERALIETAIHSPGLIMSAERNLLLLTDVMQSS